MTIDIKRLESAADMLRALAHPLRIAIIDLLEDGRRLTVTEIFTSLSIEQAAASHHLRILKHRGILISERSGKNIYYSLRHSALSQIMHCIDKCQAAGNLART